MELLSSTSVTMHQHWEFIEAASKGNLAECQRKQPIEKEHIKDDREVISKALRKALYVAMNGNHSNVVGWLVEYGMIFYARLDYAASALDYLDYAASALDYLDYLDCLDYAASALDYAARNGNMELIREIRDTAWRLRRYFRIGSEITDFGIVRELTDFVIGRELGKAGHELGNMYLGKEAELIACIEAVRHGHKDMTKAIIMSGDFTDDKNQSKDLMLLCAYNDQPELLSLLIEKTSDAQREDWWHQKIVTPLYLAAKGGSRGCSELALQYWGSHVDVNALYLLQRFSALHMAAYYGHQDVVSLLLQQSSINLQVKDVLGRTPLHYASGRGHLPVVLQLIQKLGPQDLNVSDDYGLSPLDLAVCASHTDVVKEFLNRAESFTHNNRRKSQQYTFQNLESLFHFLDPISGFLGYETSYDAPNLIDSVFWCPGAFTPLHFAAALSTPEIFEQLITFYHQRALDDVLLLKDSMGFTAYDWAKARDLGKDILSFVEPSKSKEIVGQLTNNEDTNGAVADLLMEIKRFEEMKREMKWCMDTCQALREHNIDLARRLVYRAQHQKLNITCFGQLISQTLTLHIFPISPDLQASRIKLSVNCWKFGMSEKSIEELMIHLCQVAEFTNDVVNTWLQQAILFGFEDLAYHLIVQKKVHCNTPIDMKYDLKPSEGKNLPSNSKLSAFKLAVTLKQDRMQRWMAEREDVKRGLYEDRQVYVDYANTILVGAVLIAGLAYQGWLQPPSGFHDDDGYAFVDQHSSLKVFWWFNNISFFLSVATVIAAGVGAMPSSGNEQLVDAVSRVHRAVSVASIFFPLSMICIMAAFAVAGFTILPHNMHPYQRIMKVTVSSGAVLCSLILFWFMKRLFDLNPNFKSPQLIWESVKKGTSIVIKIVKKGTSICIGFCATTIYLCILLPYLLIVGFTRLLQKLKIPCPCLILDTIIENIDRFLDVIVHFFGHYLCMEDFIEFLGEFCRVICNRCS